MKDYKEQAEYYQSRAEAFEMFYTSRLNTYKALITFGGIIAKMWSDVLAYEAKHGKTGKTDEQRNRLNSLQDLYEDFSGLDEENQKLRVMLQNKDSDIADMNVKLVLTEKLLEKHTQWDDGENN